MAATIDEVIDALLDNADFAESTSVSKAKLFESAAIRFLILSPQSQSDQGSSLTMSLATIENLLRRARDFIAFNETSNSRVHFISVSEGFR